MSFYAEQYFNEPSSSHPIQVGGSNYVQALQPPSEVRMRRPPRAAPMALNSGPHRPRPVPRGGPRRQIVPAEAVGNGVIMPARRSSNRRRNFRDAVEPGAIAMTPLRAAPPVPASSATTVPSVEAAAALSPEYDDFEIPARNLQVGKQLGSGHFSVVHHGVYRGRNVAVKIVKTKSVDSRVIFNLEVETNRAFPPHPNVVQIYGVCLELRAGNAIVAEFCGNGALHTWLRRHTFTSMQLRVRFCLDAARGLAHLHQYGVLHRDMACRNLLLTDSQRVKVSDFGLAKRADANDHGAFVAMDDAPSSASHHHRHHSSGHVEIQHDDADDVDRVYSGVDSPDSAAPPATSNATAGQAPPAKGEWKMTKAARPVRWMSPEALKEHAYSTRSDVWSFGVAMWEIVTGGAVPYGIMPNPQIKQGIISGRIKLKKPRTCPQPLWAIVASTLARDVRRRPIMRDVVHRLESYSHASGINTHLPSRHSHGPVRPVDGMGTCCPVS